MKRMVCEMCGNTELLKQDGVFVCQSCGTQYSVEEAKKMMVEIEGSVEVQGTVRVDNTDQIANYMMLANNAYNTDNRKEAELYCNKVIEIDPQHSEAWLLKGVVAAWQSTGANLRMDDFIQCATNAFNFATDPDELNALGERAYTECYDLILSINNLKLRNIISYPDTDDVVKYAHLRKDFLMWGVGIQLAYGKRFNALYADKPEDERVKPNNLNQATGVDMVNIINVCNKETAKNGIELWEKSYKEYLTDNKGYPTEYSFNSMRKSGLIAIELVKLALPKDLSKIEDEDKSFFIGLCEKLITMNKAYRDLKSYTISFSGGIESHPVEYMLPHEQQKDCNDNIKNCYDIIKACDPTYEIPDNELEGKTNKKNDGIGCAIIIAILGAFAIGYFLVRAFI